METLEQKEYYLNTKIMMNILKSTKNKLFCPLVSAIIQVSILYCLFFQYVEISKDCNCEAIHQHCEME